jgi:Endosomal/lysosomal potassium channel TMEM175
MSFDVFASELSAFFSRILVVGVAAERTVCDAGLFARVRGTKCSWGHSQFRGSLAHGEGIATLVPLIPVFLSYVLSFVYLGIYWNNHHHMLHTCQQVTG